MARSFPGGGSDTDQVVTGLATPGPFTGAQSIFIRYYQNGAGGNGFGRLFDKVNSDGTKEMFLIPSPTSNADTFGTSEGGNFSTDNGGSFFWGWILIVYDASSAANVPIWYRNGFAKTVTVNTAPSGPGTGNTGPFTIGNRHTDGARCFDGAIAEVAVWSALLPASANLAFLAGASPLTVHPESLVLYVPLLGDSPEPDYSGKQLNGTVTGTTVVAHPGVQTIGYPRPSVSSPPPSAGATDSITPALAGAGSLSATVTPYQRITVGLSGAGSLSAVVTPLQRITVGLSGAGSLAATLTPLQRITVALAGAGSLAATVTPLQEIVAALSGAGSLSATVTPLQRITAALAGQGALVVNFNAQIAITVPITGAGALTVAVTPYQRIAPHLTGTGALTATLTPLIQITVPLAGGGSLTATLTPYQRLAVNISGAGSLAVALGQLIALHAHLAGAGALTAVLSGGSHRFGHGVISDRPATSRGTIIDRRPG